MKKLGAIAISAMLTVGLSAQAAPALSDMPTGWAKQAMERAVENGLMQGSGNKIYPDKPLTRAEAAEVLTRAFGAQQESGLDGYLDVGQGDWYDAALAKAVQMGVFTGDDQRLYPLRNITREEAFVVLSRAFGLEDGETTVLNRFADGSAVSSWARPQLSGLVSGGYVSGSEGRLRPQASITRAEFAQLVSNLTEQFIRTSGEYSDIKIDGNLLIAASDVVLKNASVNGDLILGDGIGAGEVTLDNVTVQGRLVVRGGGTDSVYLKQGQIKGGVVIQNRNHAVRLAVSEGAQVGEIAVKSDFVLDGDAGKVTLESPVKFWARSGSVATLNVSSAAAGSMLSIEKGASVGAMVAMGQATVEGNGKVQQIRVQANDVKIAVPGARVEVASGVTGVKAGGVSVEPGKTVTVKDSGTGHVETSIGGSSGGGNSGGGSSGGGETPDPSLTKTTGDWVNVAKTGIVQVDFLNYAAVALKLAEMDGADFAQYDFYIGDVKQEIGKDVTKVMTSQDGTELIVKILLKNNSKPQTLRIVKNKEYMQIALNDLGISVKA
ncbi:MAG: S-layer homology domain-containing protein [Intestinibacillus sp.]